MKYARVTNSAMRSSKLADLGRDFARIAGVPFRHFFCPILYRDESAALCLGHIVNAALTRSDKYRVVQRTDVDCFYGSVCESEFVRTHGRAFAGSPDGPAQRAAIVASLLKAAHLTLFFLLGYRYALSPGGWFVGHQVLGSFFRRNSGRSRRVAAGNAAAHFTPYTNLVRRIRRATVARDAVFSPHELCWCVLDSDPYAVVPLIPVRDSHYAVIVPILGSRRNEARFKELLSAPPRAIEAQPMRLRRDEWVVASPDSIQLAPLTG